MPIVPISENRCRVERGSALVIVLFFVVLLSIVTIAFLSRSLTAIKVSAGSAGETKSRILAASASDIIIGDFKQEIIAGSTNFAGGANPNSGTVNYPVYTPTANSTAIPFMNGVPIVSSTNAIPNLISRSVSPAYAGSAPPVSYPSAYISALTPPNRAASDSSSKVNSATTSLNGRSVPAEIWNEHYLIPRLNPGSSTTTTPVSSFVPPDWVIVTRGGVNSVTWTSGSGGLNDPTLTNTNCAVGRYAYAVYNEGGLLDMNAAGYPGTDSGSGSVGLTAAQASNKSSLALADLTQLTVGTASLTQAQVNNIVGWRNYASAAPPSPGGTFGSFTFTQANASRWLTNFVQGNTNGYMQVVPTPSGVTTPPTDQVFLSRQQLISVIQSLNINPDFLQYMGTFSRALEQPSFVPNSSRPLIVGTARPPLIGSENGYQGNNDGWNGDNIINPSFLSVRVGTAFTRNDGTAAITGEPLVKTKFPLKYLTWLTYQGPSASRTAVMGNNPSSAPGNADYDIYQLQNTYGVTNALLLQGTGGTTGNVYKYFGLTYSGSGNTWVYNHGITDGSSNIIIGTLSAVAAAGREPDFAELLKASICAGSLGKAGPNLNVPGQTTNYQYTIDSSLDYHVLQLMANLIDQQTCDSFPTRIEIAIPGFSGYYRSFFGAKDLPYFYRYHQFMVVDQLPVDTSASDPSGTTCISKAQSGTATGSVTVAGDCAYLMAPDVWNPHDPSGTLTSSGLRPSSFRVSVTTDDPVSVTNPTQSAVTKVWQMGVSDGAQSSLIFSTPAALSVANTAMTFSDANGTLFREPTLLWKPNLPAGSNLSAPFGTFTEANTNRQYCGIVGGKVPAEVASNGFIYQAFQINPNNNNIPSGAWWQFTFMLEYKDALGNWVPYDVKYPDLHGLYSPYSIINTTDYPNNKFQDPLSIGQIGDHASGMDPRSARFGVGTETSLGELSTGTYGNGTPGVSLAYVLEPTANANFFVNSSTGWTAVGGSGFTVLESERSRSDKCDQSNYSNPCMTTNPGMNSQMRWFSGAGFSASNGQGGSPLEFDGLLSQNDPAVTFTARDNTTTAHLYFEDADGVNRRSMGAYVSQVSGVTPLTDTSTDSRYVAGDTARVGLPLATANNYSSDNGVGTATVQGQSRPLILNRPFRSVSDMSYAFRGTPWQNINFLTPESGDSALLDTFCVNPPPPSAMVAGKVDLNTRQIPVLTALVSGASRDELANYSAAPSWALPVVTPTEAALVAAKLVGITTDITHAWRGPLANISGLVGRYVPNPGSTGSATDLQTFNETVTGASYTYAGLSAALDSTVYTASMPSGVLAPVPYTIQRFREAGLRPMIDVGQVRVWNLLLDIVAQTGHYPKTATGLDQFVVEGQTHLWVHVAIDRYTGQVLDKQVEVVTQ